MASLKQPSGIHSAAAAPAGPATLDLQRQSGYSSAWADALVFAFVLFAIYGLALVGTQWKAPLDNTVDVDLSLVHVPLYTFFSLCRGLAAFALSLLFTLVYGYAAARVPGASTVMVPLLDILQSIPVLGFMPGVVLALAALFPSSNAGLELAAIVMIFTGQVWNMTFSFYHSLLAIPLELREAGQVFRFGWWRRLTRIELPYSTVGLVWNGMMSMAGGWFFLTVNEAFRLKDRDYRLPGIGAYMSVAIDRGDRTAMVTAVLAMTAMIVLLDQLFWRPLVAWADRFRIEDTAGGAPRPRSWVLDLLRQSRLVDWVGDRLRRLSPSRRRRTVPEGAPAQTASVRRMPLTTLLAIAILAPIGAASLWGTVKLGGMVATLSVAEWVGIGRATLLTLLRTSAAVAIGTVWTVPAGIYIGMHPRAARLLQPVVQVAASFPAPMLFPLALMLLDQLHVGLGIGSVLLMVLGTQWYILFNVIAAAASIPHDLIETAQVYRFGKWQRWRVLLLPGVFPGLVTGWVTAAGGAWNASIVSEYVHFSGEVRTTDGLGALISLSAEQGHFPQLAAAVAAMVFLVVFINRNFWRRLYDLAQRQYTVGS